MSNILKILFISSLRDKLTIFWSVILPIILLVILGLLNDDPGYRIQLLAAVTAMGILFNGLWGISFDVLLNRNNGIFKVLRITPIKTYQFILLSSLSKVIVSVVISYITIIFGILVFKLEFLFLGIFLVLPLLMMGILSFMFLGFFVGNISKKETQVSMVANLIGMPLLLLSHSFYQIPTENKVLHYVTIVNPFNYFIDGIQAFLIGNLQSLLTVLLIMGGFMVFSFIMAIVTFRWETTNYKKRRRLSPRLEA